MTQRLRISYQIGNKFDEDQNLIWSFRKNLGVLAENNIRVPLPRIYHSAIARSVRSGQVPAEFSSKFNEVISAEGGLVFLNDKFLMEADPALWDGVLWCPNIGAHAARIRAIFPDAEIRFLIGMRRPDTLLSSAMATGANLDTTDGPPDPFSLSWYELISDLRNHVPDAPVIAWSAETAPVVWDKIMHKAVELPESVALDGYLMLAEQAMTASGFARLQQYLESRGDFSSDLRQKVVSIFMGKFPSPEAAENALDLPDWDQDKQAYMDAHYKADMAAVATIEGVDVVLG